MYTMEFSKRDEYICPPTVHRTLKFKVNMAYTCLIVLDPEIPFTLPEMKGISGTDGANYKVIK